MGGVVKSVGGFLGTSSGPTVSTQTDNQGLNQLNNQNKLYYNPSAINSLNNYATGLGTSSDALNLSGLSPDERTEMGNALTTGATTGSKYATEQVQDNPILGGLFGKGGQLENSENQLSKLESQGFQLTPDDQTLYGQTSGNIARLFGAQGNQISQDLASRGLASAPSGSAGALFSGLAGNQNEMLAKAQQQIMQQRFQNTQNQIQQQAQIMENLGQQGANAIQQQYGRQLSGAQSQRSGLESAANSQNTANAGANKANLDAANFKVNNTPLNFMDAANGGAFQSIFNATSGKNMQQGMNMMGSGGSAGMA